MSRLTLIVLLLLASGLGYLAWSTLETQKEDPEATNHTRRLFPGVSGEQVTAIRFDHIERNTSLRLEKDSVQGWAIVDPVLAPCDEGVMKEMLGLVEELKGSEVMAGDDEASRESFFASAQLSPPRVEFEVEWTEDGKSQSRVIELGAIDFDGRSLLVHDVESGRVLRTLRTLDTALLRGVSEFRNPLLMSLIPERVVELHRTGTEAFESTRFGIELHAFQENDGWVSASPSISDLHPGPMGLLITNVARLRARSWLPTPIVEEVTNSPLFDEPALRLDARYPNEEIHILEVAVTSTGSWLARNLNDPSSIAELDRESAFRLSVPFELLADRRLLRAPLDLIERVTFERTKDRGDLLVLERATGGWRVIGPSGEEHSADRVAVRDLLGEIERYMFHDVSTDPSWSSDAVQAALRFEGAGETWRIEIGASTELEERSETGEVVTLEAPGVRVRRSGEELVFTAKQELVDLFLSPGVETFTDLDLVRIDELTVRSIELSGENQALEWNRSERGRWTLAGEESEAYEVLSLLDALFLLRAEAPLPADTQLALPLQVTIVGEDGPLTRYVIGEVLREDGPRIALKQESQIWLLPKLRTRLHEQLLRLVRAN